MIKPPAFEPEQCLIMAVDDVPANLKILQQVLNAVGYRTTFATRGQQVLDRLEDIKPDLILLDLMMPEMSGIDVCDRLQQNPATAHIPIIFLTASHEIEHLAQAFEYGAVDYVTKPFNAVELLARIRTHLELSQLRKQAQFQAQWEAISRQIVQDIHASIHLQDILNNTVKAIQQLLTARRVMVYRSCNPQGCKLLALSGDSLALELCVQGLGRPYLEHCAGGGGTLTKQQICLIDAAPLTPHGGAASCRTNVPQELCLPIHQQGQLWGGLVVQNDPCARPWVQREVETLTLIVQQLEISIQHAELHQRLSAANQELERISNTDGLTQIANRRCFDRQLTREWRRLQREKQPLALILCDIDYFKLFNDTYGHPSGDTCLVAVAQALKRCLKRPADLVARYGGEEFVVLLPNTELAGAIEVVEQMQGAIAKVAIADAPTHQLTLSFGIYAIVPQPSTKATTALALADQALYAAKQAGRNQYVIAPDIAVASSIEPLPRSKHSNV
ncbi:MULTISPECIES: diguanylate cyclase [Cyanophyceae]|uniref:diguanylate cyclase domain-containing protein n=1 Tax=Cyanophyceae TaxID=3028117 RepID=UPI0016868F8E|nr:MULTISPECIES: diguanylate cyclase [Cyanophyceae]MBD1915871.1 diguanylate cyclase [Phormidium sp. FACHB-77]MBD2030455.1 diguanylate cyclase [Phormidium sp. FACHB-322]MBD2053457.1 diguanylate cyclase [Leptolyngbya sp. FACHB-60]